MNTRHGPRQPLMDDQGPAAQGNEAALQGDAAERPVPRPNFGAFIRYFLYLGTFGFGGPIATVGYMQRDLVERRR